MFGTYDKFVKLDNFTISTGTGNLDRFLLNNINPANPSGLISIANLFWGVNYISFSRTIYL